MTETKTEIQIRFIRGTTWDSKVIEYRTRAWCSHTEAVYGDRLELTFGAMLKGGVQTRAFNDPLYKGVSRWEIWHIPCTQEQFDEFWGFLRDQDDKPYDWRAIVAFGMGQRDWTEPDSWFCSELITAALVAAKLVVFHGESHVDRVDPAMAYLLVTSLPGAHV